MHTTGLVATAKPSDQTRILQIVFVRGQWVYPNYDRHRRILHLSHSPLPSRSFQVRVRVRVRVRVKVRVRVSVRVKVRVTCTRHGIARITMHQTRYSAYNHAPDTV